jgi:hypothetical protein
LKNFTICICTVDISKSGSGSRLLGGSRQRLLMTMKGEKISSRIRIFVISSAINTIKFLIEPEDFEAPEKSSLLLLSYLT